MSHALFLGAPLILAAIAIDAVLGDPAWLPHPVRLIGTAIESGERALRGGGGGDFTLGAVLAVIVSMLAGTGAWAIVAAAARVFGDWGASIAAVGLAWTTIALRGLDDAAREVERAAAANDLERMRLALPALVGRDPDALDQTGAIRATVESVAENASDGVIAPLFFLFIGGPVAALVYKAINTLDSMIGYRDQRYIAFGRAAARLDDVANYVPARLTAICLVAAAQIVTGRGARACAVCRADARKHQSPNAGFPEAAVAGALGISLGGEAVYAGEIEHRAQLGDPERRPRSEDIAAARKMMRWAAAIAFCLIAIIRVMVMRASA